MLNANYTKARRSRERRAFSLLELASVLAIVGLIAAAGVIRFGSGTLENLSAEGFARTLALDLNHARRAAVATGDNHYLQLSYSGANVASYAIYRRTSAGDVPVEQVRTVPAGVTVASVQATLEFEFSGAALAAYAVSVTGPDRAWTISTTIATGAVRTTVL